MAVFIAVIIGVFALIGGDSGDTTDHSGGPNQSTEPTPSAGPTQDAASGVTDDGFLYEIIDQDHAVLTGCLAGSHVGDMPGDVDGIPVTGIAEGAFAGVSTGGYVILPQDLETIGENAFQGCADLIVVIACSDVSTEYSSFDDCPQLWFVMVGGQSVSGWDLPGWIGLYYMGMETGYGKLSNFDVGDDLTLLTGETDSGYTVLLDVRSGTETVTGLDGVDRICSRALDNLSYGATVEPGENTLYSFETFNMPFNWQAPDGAYSDQWLLSCVTAAQINAARPGGAPLMEPDLTLMEAAVIRAEEYAQLSDVNIRPNGDNWMTLLAEMGFTSGWAGTSAGCEGEYLEAWDAAADFLLENYTAVLTQSDSANYTGQYYARWAWRPSPRRTTASISGQGLY